MSAFRGSFGLNQTQDRQFSDCQVILFRPFCCGSELAMVVDYKGIN